MQEHTTIDQLISTNPTICKFKLIQWFIVNWQ